VVEERPTPCVPTPCGSNAVCREQNGAGSCSCLPDYVGNPYESCRPECVLNTDCPSNRACVRNKCQDPCPGTCGQNADCQVVNHLPSCTCRPGYSGDPFRFCNNLPPQRKSYTINPNADIWNQNVDHNSEVFIASILGVITCFFQEDHIQVVHISRITKITCWVLGGLYRNETSFVQIISLC